MSDIISLRSFYRHYQKGSSAGIVFTRSIFWFLALQGPHDAPINVKFGRDEGLWYSEFCWIVPGVWSCLPTPLCDNQLPLSFRRNQTNFCRAHDHSVACSWLCLLLEWTNSRFTALWSRITRVSRCSQKDRLTGTTTGFLWAGCPSYHSTYSVKALQETQWFGHLLFYKYKYKWGFVERGLQIVQGR